MKHLSFNDPLPLRLGAVVKPAQAPAAAAPLDIDLSVKWVPSIFDGEQASDLAHETAPKFGNTIPVERPGMSETAKQVWERKTAERAAQINKDYDTPWGVSSVDTPEHRAREASQNAIMRAALDAAQLAANPPWVIDVDPGRPGGDITSVSKAWLEGHAMRVEPVPLEDFYSSGYMVGGGDAGKTATGMRILQEHELLRKMAGWPTHCNCDSCKAQRS